MHTSTPEVIHMSTLIGRTVSSVAIRLTNFASCDPHHQNRGVKGMVGGLRQCQPIWDEFSKDRSNLIFESEQILANREQDTIEIKFDDLFLDLKNLRGETKLRELKTRVNQNVFRQIVVSNYSGKCAISGIDLPELLFASHIVPWSKNEDERLNPENGICLSALYDKAFDKGLIAINEHYKILLSDTLKAKKNLDYYGKYFASLEGQTLIAPQRYFPKKEFLHYHMTEIFNKVI